MSFSGLRRFCHRLSANETCPHEKNCDQRGLCPRQCTLDCVGRGCTVCVRRLTCQPHVARRLAQLGVMPGATLTVLQEGGGPLLVAVGATRLALGRDILHHLHVENMDAVDPIGAIIELTDNVDTF
ncbi:MAG: ferrous iron transport protein A [Caldilineaceae bacterium]|nr:ferrous iron transport protein A [Caldilineaceae bacterium]